MQQFTSVEQTLDYLTKISGYYKPLENFIKSLEENTQYVDLSVVKGSIDLLKTDYKEGSLTVDQAIKIAMMGALEIKILKEENQSLKADIAALKSKVGV